jgi:hypothetical protein
MRWISLYPTIHRCRWITADAVVIAAQTTMPPTTQRRAVGGRESGTERSSMTTTARLVATVAAVAVTGSCLVGIEVGTVVPWDGACRRRRRSQSGRAAPHVLSHR